MNFREEAKSEFEEIQNLEKQLKAASSTIASSAENENVAIFIGSTKSGKSTLINYLIGNKLRGTKDEKLRKVFIQKADHPHQHGPGIGCGPTSETVIPTRWTSPGKLPGLALWDSPGFEDNRSSSQDIINAFYIYELFKHIKTAKIVLVTDFNDILNDRINSFLSLLSSVENLFRAEFAHCFSSVVVIFTKVPNEVDDEPVNVDFVTDLIEHKILTETSLEISQSAIEFVRYLIKSDRQIGLFRRAAVGRITSDIETGIVQAILSTESIGRQILSKVSPSVSNRSKVFLHKIRQNLVSDGPLEDLGSIVEEIFMNRFDDLQRDIHFTDASSGQLRKLNRVEEKLKHLKGSIKILSNANTSFDTIIEVLEHVDCDQHLDMHDLIEKKSMMDFIGILLDLEGNTQLIMHNFECSMKTVKSNASEVMLNLQTSKLAVEKEKTRRRIEKEQEEREEIERERRKRERELRKKQEEREEEERSKKEKELHKKREELSETLLLIPSTRLLKTIYSFRL